VQLSAKFPELKEAQAELELLLVDAPGVVGGARGVPLVGGQPASRGVSASVALGGGGGTAQSRGSASGVASLLDGEAEAEAEVTVLSVFVVAAANLPSVQVPTRSHAVESNACVSPRGCVLGARFTEVRGDPRCRATRPTRPCPTCSWRSRAQGRRRRRCPRRRPRRPCAPTTPRGTICSRCERLIHPGRYHRATIAQASDACRPHLRELLRMSKTPSAASALLTVDGSLSQVEMHSDELPDERLLLAMVNADTNKLLAKASLPMKSLRPGRHYNLRLLLESPAAGAATPWLDVTLHVHGTPRAALHWAAQVRFCRYRFSPTGELGYSGISGVEG
jgi:hypothetical protein